MSDEVLRQLERRWASTGAREDADAYLVELRRRVDRLTILEEHVARLLRAVVEPGVPLAMPVDSGMVIRLLSGEYGQTEAELALLEAQLRGQEQANRESARSRASEAAGCQAWCSFECCGSLTTYATRCGRPVGHEGRHACPATLERDPRILGAQAASRLQDAQVEGLLRTAVATVGATALLNFFQRHVPALRRVSAAEQALAGAGPLSDPSVPVLRHYEDVRGALFAPGTTPDDEGAGEP